jgi:hypothetical protein
MFTALKDFFIGVLITVGVMSAPVIAPQQIPVNEPSAVVQEQIIEDTQIEDEQTPIQETATINQAQSAPIVEQVTQQVAPAPVVEETLDVKDEPEIVLEKQDARCGVVNGRKLTEEPSENLCSTGEAGTVTKDGNAYVWKCVGIADGKDQSCRAPIVTDAVCGSLANTIVPKNYNKDNFCSVGSYSNFIEIGNQMSWRCGGEYGGNDMACYATKALTDQDLQQQTSNPEPPKVSGVCGYAQNQTYDYTPSHGLCSVGDATTVTKNAPTYNWSCSGNNGGSMAQCTAKVYVAPEFKIPSQCAGKDGIAFTLCLSQYSAVGN